MATTSARRLVVAALAVETAALVLFVVTMRSRNGGVGGFALVVVAFAAWFVLAEQLRGFDGDQSMGRWALGAIAVVMLAAVVMPSRQSDDAFLYGIFGRIVSIHHANPYRTVPADVAHDAIARFVGRHWYRTPSYYGPLWIGWSALGTWIVPATKLSIRLLFQLTTALLMAAVGWVLWRRTQSIASVAVVLLQPLVVMSVVNGGHNDAAVALLSLLAVLMLVPNEAGRSRTVAAGVLFGLVALVKATALLGALGAVAWLLIGGRRRDAARVALIAGGMTAAGFAATPGSISALRSAAKQTSFLSIWQTVRSAIHPHLLLHAHVWGPENFGASRAAPVVAALAIVLTVAWVRPGLLRGAIGLEWTVAIALTSYLVLGSWVQPWHLVWALPLVVLSGSAVFRRVAGLHAAIVLALFQAEDWIRTDLWRPLRVLVIVGVPLAILALYTVAVAAARAAAVDRAGQADRADQSGQPDAPAPTGRPSII